jgi:hypothetical protein
VIESGKPLRSLENALKYYSESTPILYRGLYEFEMEIFGKLEVGKVLKPGRYSSFSEDLKIAKEFAAGESKCLAVLKSGAKGFAYWKYMVWQLEDLKNNDPEEYENSDGDYLLESTEQEKEWMMSMQAQYQVTEISKKGKFTAIALTMV